MHSRPANPIKGTALPVLGKWVGAGSAAGAGAGVDSAIKIGWSAAGAAGAGGMVPVTFACRSTTVWGTSTIFVAETFIPFLRPQASTICPSTLNFCPWGILNCWFSPFSIVRMTDRGGFTCHTVPVTLCTVVIVWGVVVTLIVRCSFIPGLLYTSDAADERSSVDLGGRRIIKKKKK